MEMVNQTENEKQKISYRAAGLFLFVSVFTTTNVLADEKQDVADLEAFYKQVFGDKEHKNNKRNKATTQKKSNIKKASKSLKDSDITAFYDQIFKTKTSIHLDKKTRNAKKPFKIKKLKASDPPTISNAVKRATRAYSASDQMQKLINELSKSQKITKNNFSKQAIKTNNQQRTKGKVRNNPVITQRVSKKSNTSVSIKGKDPELVKFYERVFGKIDKHSIHQKTQKGDLNKPKISITHHPKITTAKKTVDLSNAQTSIKREPIEKSKTVLTSKTISKDASKAHITSFKTKLSESTEVIANVKTPGKAKLADKINKAENVNTAEKMQSLIDDLKRTNEQKNVIQKNTNKVALKSANKEAKVNKENLSKERIERNDKGLLDDNILASQTAKVDLAALHQKAFGKKLPKSAPSSAPVSARISAAKTSSHDMSALFAKAFGKKAVVSGPSKINVELRVNNTTFGELELYSNSQGILDRADTKKLIELLQGIIKEHVFLRIEKEISANKQTTFEKLKRQGIDAEYNSTNLSLDLTIEPELRKPQIVSLMAGSKASVRNENKISASDMSAYLNTYTNVGLNSANQNKPDLSMRLEGSLNIGGAVLESTTDYRNDKFDFGKTTLTYDKPEKLQRFSVGNISTSSRNFQERLELDGIRISKEFFLDPDLLISPRANESIVLKTNSEVELYINNQLVRRFYLKQGVYSLEDIGLYDGANNIRIRIKDEFGKVTVKTSQQYYDSHLLKPGLSLFAFSIGRLSNDQIYTSNDLNKEIIFSGYYQKGLKKDLTMSLDAQISPDSYLLGAESIASISLGSIKNSIAISGGRTKDTGFATSFEFRPNKKHEEISLDTLRQDLLGLDTSSRGFLNNWSITGEFRDENFSLLNAVDPDLNDQTLSNLGDKSVGLVLTHGNQLKANLQTNFNLNIGDKWNASLNVGVSDYYDAKERTYANISATRRFDNGLRLSLGGRYDTVDEFSMNLQLSIPLSRKKGRKRKDLDLLVDSRKNSVGSKLSIKPTGKVGSNSFAGSLEHYQDDTTRQQNLDLNYRHHNFETKFTAKNRLGNSDGNYSQQMDLGFNTSIACVGQDCATSYPIDDSFALVSGPSNQTRPIAISSETNRFKYSEDNNSGLPDNYTALIAAKDKKAVVQLDSYRYQNINIDEGTLPSGYDSEKTEFEVFPRYQQGFLIKAGGEPATILDGMLVNAQNKPLGFKGGQWIPLNKEGKAIAFFTNKAGRFRVTSIPAGKYKLELYDYPDMNLVQVSVPDLKGEVHKVGNLIITD